MNTVNTQQRNIYNQKVALPEPDGMDVGVYYWPETVTRLVQEHIAKALETAANTVNANIPSDMTVVGVAYLRTQLTNAILNLKGNV